MQSTRSRADTDLLACTRGGDLAAFGEIVARYQQMVCAVAFATCGSRALSEDVAQETFVAAWKNIESLQDDDKLKGWLCSIARHRAKDALRKRRREVLTEDGTSDSEEFSTTQDDAPSPMDKAANLEQEQQLWHALERIPTSYREPLVLFYRDGQSIQTVADDLGLSVAAVKQRLSRGRAALRDSLAKVTSCLARSQPTKTFTVLVLAAVSAQSGVAGAASLAHTPRASAGVRTGKASAWATAGNVLGLCLALLCSTTLVWLLLGLPSDAAPAQRAALAPASADAIIDPASVSDTAPLFTAGASRSVLAGQVVDIFRRPVVGASVVLSGTPVRMARSDARGAFRFDDVEQGAYMLQARIGDSGSHPLAMHVGADAREVILEVVKGSTIELHLRSAVTGKATAGVEVTLESGSLELSATTDSRGVASFQGITTASCLARVDAPGFAASELVVYLGAEPSLHTRRLSLVPGVSLQGEVRDAQGRPIAGAKVRIEGALASPRTEQTMSDEQGRFRFDTVASEASMLIATHEHYAWITQPVSPRADTQDQVHTLIMPTGKAAAGQVVRADGTPAAFAEVVSEPSGKHTSADADGFFRLEGLEANESHLRASLESLGSSAAALRSDDDSEGLRLVLEDHSVRGVVLDAHGQAVAGAHVRATRRESESLEQGDALESARDVSNARGEFSLGPLPGDAGFDLIAIMPGVSPAYLHLAPLHSVQARSGEKDVQLRLAPPGQVSGTVTSSLGSVDSFAVTIGNYPEALDLEASSSFVGTDGSFALSQVPAGEYSIGIVATGFAPKIVEHVHIGPGKNLDLGKLRLDPGKRLRGRVLNADGLPVAGARVITGDAIAADASGLIRLYEGIDDGADPFAVTSFSALDVRTDRAGYFELSNLYNQRGALFVAAEAEGLGRSHVVEIGKRRTAELVLHLKGSGSVAGIIVGAPKELTVSAVPVQADAGGSRAPLMVQSEQSRPEFRIDGLAPGSYLFSAHPVASEPDFESGVRVEVTAGKVAQVELAMSTRHEKPWTDAALDAFADELSNLCACESEACRALSRARLDDIDNQHGMMTGVAYRRMVQLDERRRSCTH